MSSVCMPSRLALGVALAFSALPLIAAETHDLGETTVVGDWLGEASEQDVKNHPGARTVVRRQQIEESGASNVRDVLRRVPGLQVQDSNGTGGSDISLNVGSRGLTSRLSPRATILQDGIPLAIAPYGQPQLSLAPASLGNIESIDVVRGGGAVRYGPQNVGGIINFVTRGIPEELVREISYQTESAPAQGGFLNRTNAFLGGTADNGLGAALLYSGVRGDTYRDHSGTRIDDVMLKYKYALSDIDELSGSLQFYQADADMPGGLSAADFDADPYQSTRPYDSFEGDRKQAVVKYTRTPDAERQFEVTAFYNTSYRSGMLANNTPQRMTWLRELPRDYEVFGIEPRYSQIFYAGDSSHEVGIGYRYMEEDSTEKRYDRRGFGTGGDPYSVPKRLAIYNVADTEAHAFYIDDRIDIGNWTVTPGVRYERVRVNSTNRLDGEKSQQRSREPLPSLNVMYHLSDAWKLYANANTSFGSIQHYQLSRDASLKAEKAHTYEVGTRYDDGLWNAELTVFQIDFDDQLEYQSAGDIWVNSGKTLHRGVEMAGGYELAGLDPRLQGLSIYASLALTKATREEGENEGNDLPFYSREVATLGLRYETGPWTWNLDGYAQSRQFADAANTDEESADGSLGEIPGFGYWNARGEYAFGPQLANLKLAAGVKNLFGREYYTRSTDTNRGKYLGQPRTLYLQTSVSF
ncbi:TonB-dependent receptor family protein [Pseudomonas indica]|uniref:TonB-dependent receptor family protein n=1 Tax=Pseudomonas indica TaxID=137658 RepID=UPI000BAB373D|nr:TonB-dependent siderophore receptor [Pseudomonas indica]PAU63593.1 TonB-dependent siderophore receptor [Pseudomonas indica]